MTEKTLSEKTRNFLRDHPDRSYDPKTIALRIGEKGNHKTVGRLLRRLKKEFRIDRPTRGYYQYAGVVTMEEAQEAMDDTPVGFHNIHCKAKRPLNLCPLIGGTPGERTMDSKRTQTDNDDEIASHLVDTPAIPEEDQSALDEFDSHPLDPTPEKVYHRVWQGRKIEIRVHARALELIISATENQLDIITLPRCIERIAGMFDEGKIGWVNRNCGWDGLVWDIVTIEFAKDFQSLRLDGVQCVTLRDLDGYCQRWYNKKGIGLRRELVTHHEPGALRLYDLFELIDKMPAGYSNHVREHREERNETLRLLRSFQREVFREQVLNDERLVAIEEMLGKKIVIKTPKHTPGKWVDEGR